MTRRSCEHAVSRADSSPQQQQHDITAAHTESTMEFSPSSSSPGSPQSPTRKYRHASQPAAGRRVGGRCNSIAEVPQHHSHPREHSMPRSASLSSAASTVATTTSASGATEQFVQGHLIAFLHQLFTWSKSFQESLWKGSKVDELCGYLVEVLFPLGMLNLRKQGTIGETTTTATTTAAAAGREVFANDILVQWSDSMFALLNHMLETIAIHSVSGTYTYLRKHRINAPSLGAAIANSLAVSRDVAILNGIVDAGPPAIAQERDLVQFTSRILWDLLAEFGQGQSHRHSQNQNQAGSGQGSSGQVQAIQRHIRTNPKVATALSRLVSFMVDKVSMGYFPQDHAHPLFDFLVTWMDWAQFDESAPRVDLSGFFKSLNRLVLLMLQYAMACLGVQLAQATSTTGHLPYASAAAHVLEAGIAVLDRLIRHQRPIFAPANQDSEFLASFCKTCYTLLLPLPPSAVAAVTAAAASASTPVPASGIPPSSWQSDVRQRAMTLWKLLLLTKPDQMERVLVLRVSKEEVRDLRTDGFSLLLQNDFRDFGTWFQNNTSKISQVLEETLGRLGAGNMEKHEHRVRQDRLAAYRNVRKDRMRAVARLRQNRDAVMQNIGAAIGSLQAKQLEAELTKYKQHKQAVRDGVAYLTRLWGQRSESLTLDRGLWGPYSWAGAVAHALRYPHHLDKWVLDETEDPHRMRKKLRRDPDFYASYPYIGDRMFAVVASGGAKRDPEAAADGSMSSRARAEEEEEAASYAPTRIPTSRDSHAMHQHVQQAIIIRQREEERARKWRRAGLPFTSTTTTTEVATTTTAATQGGVSASGVPYQTSAYVAISSPQSSSSAVSSRRHRSVFGGAGAGAGAGPLAVSAPDMETDLAMRRSSSASEVGRISSATAAAADHSDRHNTALLATSPPKTSSSSSTATAQHVRRAFSASMPDMPDSADVQLDSGSGGTRSLRTTNTSNYFDSEVSPRGHGDDVTTDASSESDSYSEDERDPFSESLHPDLSASLSSLSSLEHGVDGDDVVASLSSDDDSTPHTSAAGAGLVVRSRANAAAGVGDADDESSGHTTTDDEINTQESDDGEESASDDDSSPSHTGPKSSRRRLPHASHPPPLPLSQQQQQQELEPHSHQRSDHDDIGDADNAYDNGDMTSTPRASAEALSMFGPADEAEEEDSDNKIKKLLEPGDEILHVYNCGRVEGLDQYRGILLLCKRNIYVIDYYQTTRDGGDISEVDVSTTPTYALHEIRQKQRMLLQAMAGAAPVAAADQNQQQQQQGQQQLTLPHPVLRWAHDDLVQVLKRRYLLRSVALEIFSVDGRNSLLVFESTPLRDQILDKLAQLGPNWNRDVPLKELTDMWVSGQLSNFDYLMKLNTCAGRSYNDLTQYPVFPWVLRDYESAHLDLNSPHSYRDLSLPMGALDEIRREKFLARYEALDDDVPRFHYGSHYSTSGVVLHYLIRLEPFTRHFLKLQGGRFDHPDRLFHSVADSWLSASAINTMDVKELVPEFYYLPEFLQNANRFDLGRKQSTGEWMDHVVLPPWARGSPHLFVRRMRQALESNYVSERLHHWIDLIFGYKQQGEAATEAMNLFYYLTYEGAVDIDQITDPIARQGTIDQINNYGQTPGQLFKRPHPAKRAMLPTATPGSASTTIPGAVAGAAGASSSSSPIVCTTVFSALVESIHPSPLKPSSLPPGTTVGLLCVQPGGNDRLVVLERFRILLPPPAGGSSNYTKQIAWGYDDMCLRILEGDRVLTTVSNVHHRHGYVTCVAADGKYVVTGGSDAVVCVYHITETDRGRPMLRRLIRGMLTGHTAAITAVAVSRTYSVIVSADAAGNLFLWDLNSLVYMRTILSPALGIGDSALPFLSLLLSGTRCVIDIIKIHEHSGDIAVCAGTTLALWSVNGDLIAYKQTTLSQNITSLAMSQGPEWIDEVNVFVTGHKDGSIRAWRLVAPDDVPSSSDPGDTPAPAAVSNPAASATATATAATIIRAPAAVFRLELYKRLEKHHSCAVTALAFNSSLKRLYSGDTVGNVVRWEEVVVAASPAARSTAPANAGGAPLSVGPTTPAANN